jgi:hypothetical protein
MHRHFVRPTAKAFQYSVGSGQAWPNKKCDRFANKVDVLEINDRIFELAAEAPQYDYLDLPQLK